MQVGISRWELLDIYTLTTSWESFQVERPLFLSPNDRKLRPKEESMEPITSSFVRGIHGSGLECIGL